MTTPIVNIPSQLTQLLTPTQASYYGVIPYKTEADKIFLYSKDENPKINELELLIGQPVTSEQIDSERISELLNKYYRIDTNSKGSSVDVSLTNEKTFLDNLLKEAKDFDASDIHCEIFKEICKIRLRIDGVLIDKYTISKEDYPVLVNKIKILSNLDIAEKRLPQDGRIHYSNHGDQFDLRVSIVPTMFGEKVVMRILNQDASRLDIEQIGLSNNQLTSYLNAVRKTNGVILISGPTGSGKTTTLYSTLKHLNSPSVNICTVEDPVEYSLGGINQIQVKPGIGLDFSKALRAFLRQDPDIIMIGEIRDVETAQIAVRASLTGHLVLSTIHTNSAVDTINRLQDMGIPSFLIASTLRLSMAQRLVRKLCENCKKIGTTRVKSQLGTGSEGTPTCYEPVGCSSCFHTGYRGRIALYELLEVDTNMAQSIREGKVLSDTLKSDFKNLANAALSSYYSGQTSYEEIFTYLD